MAQTPEQAARESVLVHKAEANLDNASAPALTPAERSELAELLEVAV
jgi:hypothetical protein